MAEGTTRMARFGRVHRLTVIGLGILAGAALAVTLSTNAHATGLTSATIAPVGSTGKCTIDPTGQTYSAVSGDLTGTSCASVTLPVAPKGFTSVTSTSTVMFADSNTNTIYLENASTNPVSVLGNNATILVAMQWTSSTDLAPTFSVVLNVSGIDLTSLVSGASNSLDVPLNAWIGATTSTGSVTLDPAALSGQKPFNSFLSSSFTIDPKGLSFQAIPVTGTSFANSLSSIGVSPSSTILYGSLSTSVSGFPGTAPTVSTGLNITATVGITNPPSLGALTFGNTATLGITGTSSSFTVGLTGSANFSLLGSTSSATSTITFTGTKSTVSMSLTASLSSPLNSAFGVSWLTVSQGTVSGTFTDTSGTLSGSASVSATATVGTAPNDVTLNFNASLDSTNGFSADLTSTSSLTSTDLASYFGITLPSGTPTFTVTNLGVGLQISTSRDVTFAVTGGVNVSFTGGPNPISASILVRVDQPNTGVGSVLVGFQAAGEKLSQLLGKSITPDFTLPSFSITISTADISNVSSTSLDAATADYFAQSNCNPAPQPGQSCSYTLNVPKGVGLSAALPFDPQSTLGTLINTLTHTTVSGNLVVSGQLPLFGGQTTALSIQLPTITPDGTSSGNALRQVALSLNLSESKGTFNFNVTGNLTLALQGTGGETCPNGVTVGSGDVCMNLQVQAALQVSGGDLSLNLTGAFSGANGFTPNNFPLTIYNITVEVGVSTGDTGAGVTIGMRTSLAFGPTNLTAAFKMQISPEPPWVEPEGLVVASNDGISMQDLVDYYNAIPGAPQIPTSALPNVSLRNLYFSISAVNDSNLCLQQGFFISADVYLGNNTSSGQAPPCLPTVPVGQTGESPSSACQKDSGTCLASVMLAVSLQGTPSISGAGYITGWSAGPLSFDPTSLNFTVSSSAVQVDISGGATLLDPVLYKSEGSSAPPWASGHLTLDVGTKKLLLDGKVAIGKAPNTLSAQIQASGNLSLSKPDFNLTEWLDQTQTFFQNAGTTIQKDVTGAVNTSKTWYQTYVQSSIQSEFNNLNTMATQMVNSGPTQWADLYNTYESVNNAVNTINTALNDLKLNSLDINVNGIINDALHGFNYPGWTVCAFGKCVTIIQPQTIGGLCSFDKAIMDEPICTESFSDFITNAQAYFADPAVTQGITNAGLSMPSGSTASAVVQRIHALDPPGTSSTVTCAMSTANYGTGSESPVSLTVNTYGNNVSFSDTGTNPFQLATGVPTILQGQISQNTFNGLYSGSNSGNCSAAPANLLSPTLSLDVNHSWINEGSSVTASGTLSNSSDTTVTITWGDGSTSTASVNADSGNYSATHTYADESGSPFTVSVAASGVTPPPTQVVKVFDTPLTLNPLTFTVNGQPATSVDIMTPVSLSGSLTTKLEPNESATVSVTWADGTLQTSSVNPDGTFSFTHIFTQLTPTGSPSQIERVSVNVAEGDGTSVGADTKLTVNDVAPTNTSTAFTDTSGGYFQYSSGGYLYPGATMFAHPQVSISMQGSAQSVTSSAALAFVTGWGDGSKPVNSGPVAKPSGPDSNNLFTYDFGPLSHTYANVDYYPILTKVSDIDTLSGPDSQINVIVTQPLGAKKRGPGTWENTIAKAEKGRGAITTDELQSYLDIAHFLSPSMPTTLAGATSVLSGATQDGLSGAPLAYAELQRDTLTSLLNFANGTWDWNQVVGPAGTQLYTLIDNANAALAANDLNAMIAATDALNPLN